MRIYTKSGDNGETGLIGGGRVSKSDLRMAVIGALDELNAMIGVLRALKPKKIASPSPDLARNDILKQVQDDLFTLGAEVADVEKKSKLPPFTAARTHALEAYIDSIEPNLPLLTNFILPTGTPLAAHAHLARAICRRAERSIVKLHREKSMNPNILTYINRLSDALFIFARQEMMASKSPEEIWKG